MVDRNTQVANLEKLLISEDLEELTNCTSNFNIFNALRLQNNEIRHSNFLGWLMSPYETHKLKDYFLKEFLKSALKNYSLHCSTEMNIAELVFFNLDDAIIKREYKNIDLLIISHQNKFICIIENKIWTSEHDNQLTRYAEKINDEYKAYKKLYIYLSPSNDDNCELIERELKDKNTVAYIPMNYQQVYEVLDKILRLKKDNINSDVQLFIRQYKDMIERDIMGESDKEVVNLCRKIYREHKEAIDLIVQNNDGKAELFEMLKEVLFEKEKNGEITDITVEDNSIIFLPAGIIDKSKLYFANDWKPDNSIVKIHVINFRWGKPMYIEILVGESNNTGKRESFIKEFLEVSKINKLNGNDKWSYTKPFNIITLDEYYHSYSGDNDAIKNIISNKINETNYIELLKTAINSAIEKGVL